MTPEGKLKKQIDKLLKSYGKHIWYFKPVSSGMGKHGVPDYIICIRGKFLAVEAKADGGKTTALQELQLRQIGEAGGYPMVVYPATLEHLRHVIELGLGSPSPWGEKREKECTTPAP